MRAATRPVGKTLTEVVGYDHPDIQRLFPDRKKHCKGCGEYLPVERFRIKHWISPRDGRDCYSLMSRCRTCLEHQRVRIPEETVARLAAASLTLSDDPWALYHCQSCDRALPKEMFRTRPGSNASERVAACRTCENMARQTHRAVEYLDHRHTKSPRHRSNEADEEELLGTR